MLLIFKIYLPEGNLFVKEKLTIYKKSLSISNTH